jgi:uncharacterized protein YbjT (DUF2867 family)
MSAVGRGVIVVTGATGLQGGAVSRHLLRAGWRVRALTRNPTSKRAQALAAAGAELVQGDMDEIATLLPRFAGAYGVYSVQNPVISGPHAEVRQGKNVADAARASGVRHLVYASAGIGRSGTGVPSWETKAQVEAYIRALDMPATILRPMAFMEVMTARKFAPAIGAWSVMPALMGPKRKVGWLCTDDLGAIAATVFDAPQQFVGKELALASDVQSLEQCCTIYREVMGRNPPRFPMPAWLFKRFGFVGQDLTTMWRWLGAETLTLDTGPTYAIYPGARTVRAWLGATRQATRQDHAPAG